MSIKFFIKYFLSIINLGSDTNSVFPSTKRYHACEVVIVSLIVEFYDCLKKYYCCIFNKYYFRKLNIY